MKHGVFKRKKQLNGSNESDGLARSQLFLSQLDELFQSFKPFLGVEFWPWLEEFNLPSEVEQPLNESGAGMLEIHAFVFHFTWQPVEETWAIRWRVDETKLSSDFPLDRSMAHKILLKKVDQTMIDTKQRRVCQTYEAHHFTLVW